MKCPNCNTDNPDTSKFCIKCGTELKNTSGGSACTKCGAPLKAGAKFCTKCGTPVSSPAAAATPTPPKAQAPAQPQPAAKSQAPVQPSAPKQTPAREISKASQSTQAPVNKAAGSGYASLSPSYESKKKEAQAPSQAPAPAPKEAKSAPDIKSFIQSSKGLVLIISLVIVALVVAILLVLKSFGVFSGSGKKDDDKKTETVTDKPDDDEDDDEDDEEEIDPETLAEIERIKKEISTYVEAGDTDECLNGYYPGALDRYITLATDYGIADEIKEDASDVFDKYAAQTRNSIALLDAQSVSSGLYLQTRQYYDEILEYADNMKAAGLDVNDSDIQSESDALIDTYRTKYIDAINDITNRENWSRDEAWNLANNAASIVDSDGNTVLFDMDDLDDPLRLRYIFCLAWATRKEVEKGVASGTLTAEEALDIIDERLEETDYNPQLIFDAISYCNAGKIDPSPYKVAFDSIMDRVCDSDGIVLVLNPEDAEENRIDINHYWAFNDISPDAERRYQVSSTNGTTAETRAWIRENIRINRISEDD